MSFETKLLKWSMPAVVRTDAIFSLIIEKMKLPVYCTEAFEEAICLLGWPKKPAPVQKPPIVAKQALSFGETITQHITSFAGSLRSRFFDSPDVEFPIPDTAVSTSFSPGVLCCLIAIIVLILLIVLGIAILLRYLPTIIANQATQIRIAQETQDVLLSGQGMKNKLHNFDESRFHAPEPPQTIDINPTEAPIDKKVSKALKERLNNTKTTTQRPANLRLIYSITQMLKSKEALMKQKVLKYSKPKSRNTNKESSKRPQTADPDFIEALIERNLSKALQDIVASNESTQKLVRDAMNSMTPSMKTSLKENLSDYTNTISRILTVAGVSLPFNSIHIFDQSLTTLMQRKYSNDQHDMQGHLENLQVWM